VRTGGVGWPIPMTNPAARCPSAGHATSRPRPGFRGDPRVSPWPRPLRQAVKKIRPPGTTGRVRSHQPPAVEGGQITQICTRQSDTSSRQADDTGGSARGSGAGLITERDDETWRPASGSLTICYCSGLSSPAVDESRSAQFRAASAPHTSRQLGPRTRPTGQSIPPPAASEGVRRDDELHPGVPGTKGMAERPGRELSEPGPAHESVVRAASRTPAR